MCRSASLDGPPCKVWTAWLDELGVSHTGGVDETDAIVYSTVVFRDPDNIQLQLIAVY